MNKINYKVLRARLFGSSPAQFLRRYISPVFVVMLLASSILWYITKLGHSYTTDLGITVRVAKQSFDVECVVEGVGTNLFGYHLYSGGTIDIPLSELKYKHSGSDKIIFEKTSLLNALSVRYSDIKIISIDSDATIVIDDRVQREIDKLKK